MVSTYRRVVRQFTLMMSGAFFSAMIRYLTLQYTSPVNMDDSPCLKAYLVCASSVVRRTHFVAFSSQYSAAALRAAWMTVSMCSASISVLRRSWSCHHSPKTNVMSVNRVRSISFNLLSNEFEEHERVSYSYASVPTDLRGECDGHADEGGLTFALEPHTRRHTAARQACHP